MPPDAIAEGGTMATDWTTVAVAGITGSAGLGGGFVAAWAQHRWGAAQQRAQWDRDDRWADRKDRRAVVRELVEAVQRAATWRGAPQEARDGAQSEDYFRLIRASAAAQTIVSRQTWRELLWPYINLALVWSHPPGREHRLDAGIDPGDHDEIRNHFHQAVEDVIEGATENRPR